MSRNIWIGIVVVAVLVAGGWWYFNQSSAPVTSTLKVLLLYSENFNPSRKTGSPVLLHLENGLVQGLHFALLRSGSDTFYSALGIDTKKPSGDWCTGISMVIEVTNPELETDEALTGGQKVLVLDLVRIVSHDQPRQVCVP